jgi:hypothetical protein
MTEISISIEKLPALSEKSWLETKCEDRMISLRMICQWYRNWIVVGVFLLIIGIFIILILTNQTTYSYPCLIYDTNTLASTVSIACLQYSWDQNCATKSPYTFSQGYTGWWNQSPQGTTMVPCYNGLQGTLCGVGSYGNIRNTMQFCQIRYNQ